MMDTRTTTGVSYNNPLSVDSMGGWGLSSQKSYPIEGWGAMNAPAGVPVDSSRAILNVINWFIGVNVIIIIFGAIIYSIRKYKKKHSKRS